MESREIICLGRRRVVGGKLAWFFITAEQLTAMIDNSVSPDAIEFAASAFEAKRKAQRFVVGGRYETEVQCDDDGKIQRVNFSKNKFLGRLADHPPLVEVWEVKDKTASDTHNGEKAHERVMKEPNINRLFAQLGTIYRRLPPGDRDGFELMLIRHLRKR